MDDPILRDFSIRVGQCFAKRGMLPVRDQTAVLDFAKLLKSRNDSEALGLALWYPSVRQINYLNRIWEML